MRYPNGAFPGVPSESFEYEFEADFEADLEEPDEPPAAMAFKSANQKMDVRTQEQLATARRKVRQAKPRFQQATRILQQAWPKGGSDRELEGPGPASSGATQGRWVRQGGKIILLGV